MTTGNKTKPANLAIKDVRSGSIKKNKTNDKNSAVKLIRWFLYANGLLIIIILIIIGSMLGYQIAHRKTQQQQLTTVEQHYQQLIQTQAKLQANLAQLQQQDKQQQVLLQQQQQHLAELTSPKQQAQQQIAQWQRAKLVSLVQLANYALVFTQDPGAALRLLSMAHDIVLGLNPVEPAVIQLKQALNPVLHQLQQQKQQQIDREQWFNQIQQLIQVVPDLPLIGTAQDKKIKRTKTEAQTQTQTYGWHHAIQQTWQQLKSLIVIRQQADGLKPMVARQGGDYIQQYISLQLSQSQWALLHNNNQLYQASLQQASTWLRRYYVASSTKVQHGLQQLTQLQQQSIAIKTVDLQALLTAAAALVNLADNPTTVAK